MNSPPNDRPFSIKNWSRKKRTKDVGNEESIESSMFENSSTIYSRCCYNIGRSKWLKVIEYIGWQQQHLSTISEPPKLLVNFKFSTKSSLITISTCVFYFRYFYNSKLIEQRTWMPQGHFPPSFLLQIKFSWLFYHWYTIRNSFWCCDSLSYSFIRCFVHSFTMEANTMETATM